MTSAGESSAMHLLGQPLAYPVEHVCTGQRLRPLSLRAQQPPV
jgi:hypothetical protein